MYYAVVEAAWGPHRVRVEAEHLDFEAIVKRVREQGVYEPGGEVWWPPDRIICVERTH